ncbi:UDP-sugar transporter protein SLC35A5 isoform X8 [Syngnathoides biaculeatus]|uniref:UDP-sugar transporter protein SLC35A5 isoform X8 n=1 Tax=Syngnathoides biaculeatus TaxID=300417 RepID=UPI002ADE79E9|nr:UDP-sugar transporter protein SLC35A5 isoform X8 [Syngnathoides biaculeatus]
MREAGHRMELLQVCSFGMARQRRCSRSSAYTLALGSSFVALGTGRILLLKFSANADNKYDFLPASVNMLAEALKLLFCLLMSLRVFIREGRSCRDASRPSARTLVASLKWAVPAFLYFLDNLIIFYVMTYLQPAMAVLSSNFVILTTAVLFRLVLKRRLSWVQWAALVILFLSIVSLSTGSGGAAPASGVRRSPLTAPTNSCLLYAELLQQMRNSSADGPPGRRDAPPGRLRRFGAGHVLLLLQCFVSAAANVYNEKILKDGEQLTESIFVQNSKLQPGSVGGFHLEIPGQHVPRAERPDHRGPGGRPLAGPLRLPPVGGLLPAGARRAAGHLHLQRQPAARPPVQPAAGRQRGAAEEVPRGALLPFLRVT